jgi:hypothetical protein
MSYVIPSLAELNQQRLWHWGCVKITWCEEVECIIWFTILAGLYINTIYVYFYIHMGMKQHHVWLDLFIHLI